MSTSPRGLSAQSLVWGVRCASELGTRCLLQKVLGFSALRFALFVNINQKLIKRLKTLRQEQEQARGHGLGRVSAANF